MSSITRKLVLLTTAACLLLTSEAAKQLHNPLRVRVNSELIKNVFHKRDQDMLHVLTDIDLGSFKLGDHATIDSFQVSFEPLKGARDEFDYKLSLDQSKYIGIESDNIKIRGAGKLSHNSGEPEEFTIEGPVSDFRVAFQVDQAAEQKKIAFKGIDLKFNNGELEIKSSSQVF